MYKHTYQEFPAKAEFYWNKEQLLEEQKNPCSYYQ